MTDESNLREGDELLAHVAGVVLRDGCAEHGRPPGGGCRECMLRIEAAMAQQQPRPAEVSE